MWDFVSYIKQPLFISLNINSGKIAFVQPYGLVQPYGTQHKTAIGGTTAGATQTECGRGCNIMGWLCNIGILLPFYYAKTVNCNFLINTSNFELFSCLLQFPSFLPLNIRAFQHIIKLFPFPSQTYHVRTWMRLSITHMPWILIWLEFSILMLARCVMCGWWRSAYIAKRSFFRVKVKSKIWI